MIECSYLKQEQIDNAKICMVFVFLKLFTYFFTETFSRDWLSGAAIKGNCQCKTNVKIRENSMTENCDNELEEK